MDTAITRNCPFRLLNNNNNNNGPVSPCSARSLFPPDRRTRIARTTPSPYRMRARHVASRRDLRQEIYARTCPGERPSTGSKGAHLGRSSSSVRRDVTPYVRQSVRFHARNTRPSADRNPRGRAPCPTTRTGTLRGKTLAWPCTCAPRAVAESTHQHIVYDITHELWLNKQLDYQTSDKTGTG